MSIARATIMQRTTVTQSLRQILPTETNASIVRKVQLLIPMQPPVYAVLTPDARFINDDGKPATNVALAAGYDRYYKGTLLPPGAQISFHLMPDQAIWAACEIEYAEIGLICEYLEPTEGMTPPVPEPSSIPVR
jgi:hypothetical protein